jgi:hypothetical protein
MRRAAVALLLMGLAVAGCTHPTRNPPSRSAMTRPTSSVLTPPTQAGSMPSIRGRSTRPAGWKAVRYRGLRFFVPATWRVRDGRRFPCPGMLRGPAMVLGHSDVIHPVRCLGSGRRCCGSTTGWMTGSQPPRHHPDQWAGRLAAACAPRQSPTSVRRRADVLVAVSAGTRLSGLGPGARGKG